MATKMITVTLHADDPIARAGLAGLLRGQPEIEILERPVQSVGHRSVAVVLVDRVDDDTAVKLRRLVRGESREAVLIATRLHERELLNAVACGVRTFVWRHQATAEALAKAVRSAARGDSEVPADMLNRLLVQLGRHGSGASPVHTVTGLSDREVEVLRFVAEGLENRQIAGKLSYSERTVKNILHGLMTRMQLRNRAHAVAFALREGYL
ncbi:helix-turn-helix transcriptional regulator [Streptomyces gibsoniae]|uniref:Response regulator transcription factor n=1 Tax=Streptomyces gibsoniae TaxID=3075529 RepID=A0ABU2U4E3_9ACTN|nr:response regulator transcription factor [Streptomyces sp. DSM 41699]MDT0468092.1 response regulator transcription factor [Streptomyces sp. DSM 41699]